MGIDQPSRRQLFGLAAGGVGAVAGVEAAAAQGRRKSPEAPPRKEETLRPQHYVEAEKFAGSFLKMVAAQEKEKTSDSARDEQIRAAIKVYISSFAAARNVQEPTNALHARALEFAIRELPFVQGIASRTVQFAEAFLRYWHDEFNLLAAVGDRSDPLESPQHPDDPRRTSGEFLIH